MVTSAKFVTITEFKAKGLKTLDRANGSSIFITRRGRPVARVTPIRSEPFAKLYGNMKGKIKVKGNIFSTGIKWDAQS